MLAGFADPQVREIDLPDVDGGVVAGGQAVEQVLAEQVEPLQVRIGVRHDLGEERVLADVVPQRCTELLSRVRIFALKDFGSGPGRGR
ncbi:MAG: hypothetical protein ACRDWI_13590 [Jiangellaceae bacterium]